MSNASLEPAPFCSECGYDLSKATESSKCPECGRPLVDVLMRDKAVLMLRRRYESEGTLLGLPLVSIAFGMDASGKKGHAKGWIAFGDKATGVFAMGGIAFGLVAIGGVSVGGLAFGGLSIGLFLAAGGFAAALGLALGGFAIGSFAAGGLAIGYMAMGGYVIAIHGMGGQGVVGKGLPFTINWGTFRTYIWIVFGGIGLISAIPGIILSMMNRRWQRNRN